MAERMRRHIDDCKASGMYVEEYCKLHQLKPSLYYYWRRKLMGSVKKDTGGFIQLQAPPVSAGCIEIILLNGVKIHFSNLVSADYIKQLVG